MTQISSVFHSAVQNTGSSMTRAKFSRPTNFAATPEVRLRSVSEVTSRRPTG
eukprot:gene1930-1963_t